MCTSGCAGPPPKPNLPEGFAAPGCNTPHKHISMHALTAVKPWTHMHTIQQQDHSMATSAGNHNSSGAVVPLESTSSLLGCALLAYCGPSAPSSALSFVQPQLVLTRRTHCSRPPGAKHQLTEAHLLSCGIDPVLNQSNALFQSRELHTTSFSQLSELLRCSHVQYAVV